MGEKLDERDWLCALVQINGLGRKRIRRIYEDVGTFAAFGSLNAEVLRTRWNVPIPVASQMEEQLKKENVAAMKVRNSEQSVHYVCFFDEYFPEQVKEIPDPPLLLYYDGHIELLQIPLIAVVGTRKPTPYGRSACQCLTEQLSKWGLGIVSGLAIGIDTIAHQSTLKSGGTTVAVLGSGLDTFYPPSNSRLHQEIADKGLVLSEYPPGTKPHPGLFPERNRIISGLALGTLVIEGAEKSGSLITADFALEQGRDVFAVPGPIFSEMSKGPHNLVKQGAKLVTNAVDIVEEWTHLLPTDYALPIDPPKPVLTANEQALYSHLSHEPVHWNQLFAVVSKEDGRMLDKDLLTMETKGLIRSLPGGFFVKS